VIERKKRMSEKEEVFSQRKIGWVGRSTAKGEEDRRESRERTIGWGEKSRKGKGGLSIAKGGKESREKLKGVNALREGSALLHTEEGRGKKGGKKKKKEGARPTTFRSRKVIHCLQTFVD